MEAYAFDTSTYEYNKSTLSELGLAAQAAIQTPEIFEDFTIENSKQTLDDLVRWLREDRSNIGYLMSYAMSAASTRTHPRHLIDASRFLAIDRDGFGKNIELLKNKLLSVSPLTVSDETRRLAAQAIKVIEIDSQITGTQGLHDWAKTLAADCLMKKD